MGHHHQNVLQSYLRNILLVQRELLVQIGGMRMLLGKEAIKAEHQDCPNFPEQRVIYLGKKKVATNRQMVIYLKINFPAFYNCDTHNEYRYKK